MRRFFTTSIIALSLLTSIVGAGAPIAYAAVGEPCTASNGARGTLTAGDICNVLATDSNAADAANGVTVDQAAAQTPTSFGSTVDDILGSVMSKILSIFAWLLGVAMVTLDSAVYYTVVKMGDYVQNLKAVGIAWRILRDIGNIALIFGFLAVGITTILNVDWYGGGKKFLPSLLIAAVFLNFSLFMTEAVIDTGNLFATQFYTQINGGTPAGAKLSAGSNVTSISGVTSIASSIGDEVISQKIMNTLGLQSLYGAARDPSKQVFKGDNITFISLMGILLFIVAAFVMFSLAFILIVRFVALIFVIILSPVGFAGYAIPQLASTSKKWLDTLTEQTITAPILLLLLYIALAVITDENFLGFGVSGPDYTGFIQNTSGGFNLSGLASALLSFSVAMGLLLSVTYFSKKLGAMGGDWATKTAGKLSFGATAWAGRTSGGWLANKTARKLRGTAFGRIPLVGTGLVKGLDSIGSASFDVRGTGALKNFPGGGIDAGKAQKGGYKADLKSRIDSRTKYAAELTGSELTKEQKVDQIVLQNQIKAFEKMRGKTNNPEEVKSINEKITTAEGKLEELESQTDKGARLKYAKALNLWSDDKNFFNTYINFAANYDAAINIRKEAKKSSEDKSLDELKKLLKKEEKEEKEENPASPSAEKKA